MGVRSLSRTGGALVSRLVDRAVLAQSRQAGCQKAYRCSGDSGHDQRVITLFLSWPGRHPRWGERDFGKIRASRGGDGKAGVGPREPQYGPTSTYVARQWTRPLAGLKPFRRTRAEATGLDHFMPTSTPPG